MVLVRRREHGAGVAAFERALALNPTFSGALRMPSTCGTACARQASPTNRLPSSAVTGATSARGIIVRGSALQDGIAEVRGHHMQAARHPARSAPRPGHEIGNRGALRDV
jgi:hypothetical protein